MASSIISDGSRRFKIDEIAHSYWRKHAKARFIKSARRYREATTISSEASNASYYQVKSMRREHGALYVVSEIAFAQWMPSAEKASDDFDAMHGIRSAMLFDGGTLSWSTREYGRGQYEYYPRRQKVDMRKYLSRKYSSEIFTKSYNVALDSCFRYWLIKYNIRTMMCVFHGQ